MIVDEFEMNRAQKIWPMISDDTRIHIADSSRDEYALVGLRGTETINLMLCNEARFIKWGYGPIYDVLVITETKSPVQNIAIWTGEAWLSNLDTIDHTP